jgi:hypothetical protein
MIAKFILLAGLLLTQASAALPNFRYSRPILYPNDGQQALLAVTLDDLIYAASMDNFQDLRITDQDGIEIPFLLQKITTRKTVVQRLPSRSDAPKLQKNGTEGIVITLSLDKDAANADGMTVVTAQRNFEYDLQIFGAADSQDWQLLVDNATIYDYSRYMDVSYRDIALPTNSYRHFKIVVSQATQTRAAELQALTRTLRGDEELQRTEKINLRNEPLHIERIEFWHNRSETLPEIEQKFEYPVVRFKVSQDTEHKTSLIDIDSLRQPLTGFSLHTNAPNFSRPAEVQIPLKKGIETRMHTVGSGTLEALHFQDIEREQNRVNFQQQRQPNYRIVIHNQDNPPLAITAVNGIGNGYQLLFLPHPGQSYQVHYGTAKAESPHYDTAPIRELLRRGYQSTAATLGSEVMAEPAEEKLDLAQLLNSKLFLGIAISLMVCVLAWSLYRVSKRIGELPK